MNETGGSVNPIKCFYHSADLDGKCSAFIVQHSVAPIPVDFFPINYDQVDRFPWDKIGKDDVVYMVDFSLPNEMMLRLREMCADFIWIDHHKTAIESVKGDYWGLRRIGSAGCELAWEYFFIRPDTNEQRQIPVPRFVTLLGRYDVWDKDHPEWRQMLELQTGMRLVDNHPAAPIWNQLMFDQGTLDAVIRNGATALVYREQTDASYAKAMAFPVSFEGLRCIAMNRAQVSSQSFDAVYDPARHDVMVAFAYNGHKWIVSLYSDKPEVDCGAICKKHGGGGHKGAAGFHADRFPFGENEDV